MNAFTPARTIVYGPLMAGTCAMLVSHASAQFVISPPVNYPVGPGPKNVAVADLDGDGVVGVLDLLDLLANWGACP